MRREFAPGLADGVKDGVVIIKHPVRQMALAQVEPDPFDRVQLRRVGWQAKQRQIGWDGKIVAGVPSSTVKHHHGVLVLSQGEREPPQECVHRHGGDGGQHQAEIPPGGRLNGGEGVDECVALIERSGWPVPAQPPAMASPALLAEPCLILEEQRDPLAWKRLGRGRQSFWQRLF